MAGGTACSRSRGARADRRRRAPVACLAGAAATALWAAGAAAFVAAGLREAHRGHGAAGAAALTRGRRAPAVHRASSVFGWAQGSSKASEDAEGEKALKEMLEEIKKRATKAEQEKRRLADKVEKLEASAAAVKKEQWTATVEANGLRAKAELAESQAASFREALDGIAATVSAAVNDPDSDPVKLLEAATAELAASEEKVALTLKEKEEVDQQVEALEKELEEAGVLRAELEAAEEKAKKLSAGIDAIAARVGVSGGVNLFSLFSAAPSDEEKVKSILEKVKTMQKR